MKWLGETLKIWEWTPPKIYKTPWKPLPSKPSISLVCEMLFGRVSSRLLSRISLAIQNSFFFYTRSQEQQQYIPLLNQLRSLHQSHDKVVADQVSLLHHSILSSFSLQQRFSSSASSHGLCCVQ